MSDIAVKANSVAKTKKSQVQTAGIVQESRNNRKVREGIVVSNKMDKTIVVLVQSKQKHPLYKKTINKSKKFKAHDELNECGIGDTVEIAETRKLSKDKCWRLKKVLEKAK